MRSHIHPTAQISAGARVHPDAEIGAYTVVHDDVEVMPGARIGAHCVLGSAPKIRGFDGETAGVCVGQGAFVAEHCSIDAGSEQRTLIGGNAYIMPHCYVGHDTQLGPSVTLTANVQLGGHVRIGRGATFGLGATVHQFSYVGAYCMVGMQSAINRDLPPFATVAGVPARLMGINRVGMARAGFSERDIESTESNVLTLLARRTWDAPFGRREAEEFLAESLRPWLSQPRATSATPNETRAA